MSLTKVSRFCTFLSLLTSFINGYEIPTPKVEYLTPRGFSISIPGKLCHAINYYKVRCNNGFEF